MDSNLKKIRSYYYEFLAIPFFFYENDEKFNLWKEQLNFLKQAPIKSDDLACFENLEKFSFEKFKTEQNAVLFDFSYANVPLTASFYDEGRDDGRMRLLVIDTLKKSKFRRDMHQCKDSEDFIGFVLYLASTLLKEDETFLSTELFANVTNTFVDEFCELLSAHEKSDFFKNLSVLMSSFFALERSVLSITAPKKEKSVAKESLARIPYENRFKNPKTIFKKLD